jgi:hypothetical protein
MVAVSRFLIFSSPEEVANRLKEYWSAMSVTLALVGTMAFSGIITIPQPSSHWTDLDHVTNLQQIACGVFSLSLLLAGYGVALCLIFFAQINQLPENSIIPFLVMQFIALLTVKKQFYWAFWFTKYCFVLSIVSLMVGTAFFIAITQGKTLPIVFGVVAAIGTVLVSAVFFTRNYTSKEMQRKEKSKSKDITLEKVEE